ncbi:hypothetical protein POM88_002959 [Heracleum sosnowskyi]|uniref:Uncharacterized protein n=1 Tax=Heracleum sosnowskyi TaxID=360622 RepID=A0AAD8NB26_9APIA|nr:hypothetical protein POM88_002959 [Heracleum sosnowskyi]
MPKEIDYVKLLWNNRQEVKVENLGIAALFGLECYAWYCAGAVLVGSVSIISRAKHVKIVKGLIEDHHITLKGHLETNFQTYNAQNLTPHFQSNKAVFVLVDLLKEMRCLICPEEYIGI